MADLAEAFEEALARGRHEGAARCDDSALMALYCQDTLPLLVGAIAPKLVWEGAQRSGVTPLQLNELAATEPLKVADLMWID